MSAAWACVSPASPAPPGLPPREPPPVPRRRRPPRVLPARSPRPAPPPACPPFVPRGDLTPRDFLRRAGPPRTPFLCLLGERLAPLPPSHFLSPSLGERPVPAMTVPCPLPAHSFVGCALACLSLARLQGERLLDRTGETLPSEAWSPAGRSNTEADHF